MKVLTVVGARPQFIKSAPVSKALQRAGIQEMIVHSGQHYDQNMSAVFFKELEIPQPDINLGVGSGPHGQQTGQMLMQIENVLQAETPDWVMVYGDTNSTLAGALAAAKLDIPVAHVEAGLRSNNKKMPEEINRLVTDHVSTLLLCPTQTAVENLSAEGIKEPDPSARIRTALPIEKTSDLPNQQTPPKVMLVGDVMYDSLLGNTRLALKRSDILNRLKLVPKTYALATVHRAENTNDKRRLKDIFSALETISSDGLPIIVPLHPRTRKCLKQTGLPLRSVKTIDPVSYLDMLLLEKSAEIIFTDSGGIQKEAYWMQVPCITLRDETEWIETVNDGWNFLVGADRDKIVESAKKKHWPCHQNQSFGDGRSADKIVSALIAVKRRKRS